MSSYRFRTPARCWLPCGRASVNPVDFKIRAVKDDRFALHVGSGSFGSGRKMRRRNPGDEVFGMVNIYGGGYAEKAVVDQRAITLKPAGIDHIHAAAVPLAGQTAW